MSSKKYVPLRHKSISIALQNEKRHYDLRPHVSKVHKEHTPGPSACNQRRSFRNLGSVMDMKKCSTPNPASMAKRQNTGGLQSSSGMDVSGITDEPDFAGFSDMEDAAFQLAKYVESDASFDEVITVAPKPNLPKLTPSDVFDLRVETMSMSDASLDELLDISINELQKAASPSNADTYNVSFSNGTSLNQMETKCPTFLVNNGNSKRCSDEKDANVYVDRQSEPAPNAQSRKSFPASRHRSMCSKESVMFGDRRRTICASRPMPNGSHATFKKQIVSTPLSKGPVNRTPYEALTKNAAHKQKVFHLFNRPCHNYLNGCCSGSICKWNHTLPPTREIYKKLMLLNDETVQYVYFNFVLRTTKAFVTYFESMCEVLGKRKMKSILVGAIRICEERDHVEYLKFVFNGLLFNGSSKRDALTIVMECCSKSRKCYDILLEIMIDSDALYFVDSLKQYCSYGNIRTESLHKLLQQVVDAPGTALLPVFIDILDRYSIGRTFDEEAFKCIVPRAAKLVKGDLKLKQQLDHIVKRSKPSSFVSLA